MPPDHGLLGAISAEPSPVPEPSTAVLGLIAVSILARGIYVEERSSRSDSMINRDPLWPYSERLELQAKHSANLAVNVQLLIFPAKRILLPLEPKRSVEYSRRLPAVFAGNWADSRYGWPEDLK